MRFILLFLLSCCLTVRSLYAAEQDFVITDIRVNGLQKITTGTVFNYLPVKVGDHLTKKSVQDSIRALFKTGFFKEITIKREGTVLVVDVVERPSISKISIEGSSDISEEDLKKSLKNIGLAEGRIFNRSILEGVEQELKRQYFSRGRYSVKIDPVVTPLERNRVDITIDIKEGKVARIKEINIVGNKVFTDKELLGELSLSDSGLFTFISGSDKYSKQKLIGDLEKLRNYYQDRGFLEFSVDSTQVAISPDKENIYITINVTERKKYKNGAFNIAGDYVLPENEIRQFITIKEGELFSRKEVTTITKNITDYLGKNGYAFANVNAIPDIDREKGIVSHTFFIDPGKRVYVRRININGNNTTKDEVIRREMRQLEGAWFSPEKVKRSRIRLQRLGFFDQVNVETPQVPGTSDQVDVNVTVRERATGNLLFGVGYSDFDGVLVNGSVSESNLFGTGKTLSARLDYSRSTKSVNLRYINPYYTKAGVSREFRLFGTDIDAQRARIAAYSVSTSGLGMIFGLPISELRTVSAGLSYEYNKITVPDDGAQVAKDFINQYGELNRLWKFTFSWAQDSLNNAIFPTAGGLQRLSLEATIPGSELEYYRANYEIARYVPLYGPFTFRAKGEISYGDGYGNTEGLPFYRNYFAGGSATVRGYRSRSLGPRDAATGDPIGGNKRVLANMDLFFPVPGVDADSSTMRLSLFADAGMVYGPCKLADKELCPPEDIDLGELRYSAGLAFSWFSPVGPLVLSYGIPLNDKRGDRIENFQFNLGVPLR